MDVAPILFIIVATVAGALSAQIACAQDAISDCGPPLIPQMCVDFNASRSVDPAAGEFIYRWQMGDCATQEVMVVP